MRCPEGVFQHAAFACIGLDQLSHSYGTLLLIVLQTVETFVSIVFAVTDISSGLPPYEGYLVPRSEASTVQALKLPLAPCAASPKPHFDNAQPLR